MIYAEKNVFSMQKLSQLMQESPPNCCKYCDCIGTCIISDDIYWLVETCSLTWTILYSEISHDTEINCSISEILSILRIEIFDVWACMIFIYIAFKKG